MFCLGSPQVFLMVLDRFSSGSPKVLLRFSLGSSQVLLRYSPPSTPQVLLRFSTGSPRFSSGSPQVLLRFSSGSKVLLMFPSGSPLCYPQLCSIMFSSGKPHVLLKGSPQVLLEGSSQVLHFSSGSHQVSKFFSGSGIPRFSSCSPQENLRF